MFTNHSFSSDFSGEEDDTPLHTALKLPASEIVTKAILEGGASLTVTDGNGKLPTQIKSEVEELNELVLQYARN